MAKNYALQEAARVQQDEFYTDRHDVEDELMYYWDHFRGKTILCNCDDPYESEFFKYFALRFNVLELRKLIATYYAGSPIAQQQLSLFEEDIPTPKRKPYCATITKFCDYNGDRREDMLDIEYILTHNEGGTLRVLEGDGDFRSPECVELLKEADVVVTNPPFSLFREYVALLMKYNKKFIIMGNKNAITYKEIFPLFMQNKIWIGVRNMNRDFWLHIPQDREDYETIDEEGNKRKHIMACWFTNLDHHRHNATMVLFRRYHENPDKYPHYDNYDAIEVSKVADIPCDYDGVMGVPITFMDKYNPRQFEIVGRADANIADENNPYHIPGFKDKGGAPMINGRFVYKRILIRKIADFL